MYWYLDSNNNQMGPVEATDLPYYGVDGNTMIWTEGMDNWTYARNVPEVMAIILNAEKSGQGANTPPQGGGAQQGYPPQGGGAQQGYPPQGGGAQQGYAPQGGGTQQGYAPQGGGAQQGFGPQNTGPQGVVSSDPFMNEVFAGQGQRKSSGMKTFLFAVISFFAALIIGAVILAINDSSKMKTAYLGMWDASALLGEDSLYKYELLEKYGTENKLMADLTLFDKSTKEEIIHMELKGKHELVFTGTPFFGRIFKGRDSGYVIEATFDTTSVVVVYSKPFMKQADIDKIKTEVNTTGAFGKINEEVEKANADGKHFGARIVKVNKKTMSVYNPWDESNKQRLHKIEELPNHDHKTK